MTSKNDEPITAEFDLLMLEAKMQKESERSRIDRLTDYVAGGIGLLVMGIEETLLELENGDNHSD